MNESNGQIIVDSIRDYLVQNGIDFENHDLIRNIKDRKNGRVFTFDDNIKGLIYAQLSNQTKWKNIAPKLPHIDQLFFNYEKRKLLETPASYFYEGIFKLKCGNIATKNQMKSLAENIHTLERIERDFGSLDEFYSSYPTPQLAKILSSGEYKMKYIGYALAWEFLRNNGIDGAKPDTHMCRILGADRLGFSKHSVATETETIQIIDKISRDTGYLKSYIDILFWSYCADGYGEICTADPNCHKCVVRQYCRQNGGV
ncbi:MAG: hypothetical protein IBX70_13795 [Clostridia bacterium]|nr:hypothetical protein [Clostridia bacterium]